MHAFPKALRQLMLLFAYNFKALKNLNFFGLKGGAFQKNRPHLKFDNHTKYIYL